MHRQEGETDQKERLELMVIVMVVMAMKVMVRWWWWWWWWWRYWCWRVQFVVNFFIWVKSLYLHQPWIFVVFSPWLEIELQLSTARPGGWAAKVKAGLASRQRLALRRRQLWPVSHREWSHTHLGLSQTRLTNGCQANAIIRKICNQWNSLSLSFAPNDLSPQN